MYLVFCMCDFKFFLFVIFVFFVCNICFFFYGWRCLIVVMCM